MAPTVPAKNKSDFDPRKFLATIGQGRKVVSFAQKQTIFTQGDAADPAEQAPFICSFIRLRERA